MESAPKKAFLGLKPALVCLEERGRKENFVCPFVASGRFWIFVWQGYSRSMVEMESAGGQVDLRKPGWSDVESWHVPLLLCFILLL